MKRPPVRYMLPRVKDRWTFVYVERCVVHRDKNAVTFRDRQGTIHFPAAQVAVLMLGPGTSVSHQAMVLLGESGTTTVWVGSGGVAYYAHGRSLADSNALLQNQARAASSQNERIAVARHMYSMRFDDEDVSGLSMQQLRGREGTRMKRLYRTMAQEYGVPWDGRQYVPDDFEAADPVNQALTAGNAVLYGLVHAVIVGLGCAPGLGIVHAGHERSFVFDIADLYKAQYVVPLAFELAADEAEDIAKVMRYRLREAFFETRLLKRIVDDIFVLLDPSGDCRSTLEVNVVNLWDYQTGMLAGGINYGEDFGSVG